MALLNVDKLSVHFGDENAPFRAVDRISYSVNQGEVVGIVGESGSGKSVSSLAIMGLRRRSSSCCWSCSSKRIWRWC